MNSRPDGVIPALLVGMWVSKMRIWPQGWNMKGSGWSPQSKLEKTSRGSKVMLEYTKKYNCVTI